MLPAGWLIIRRGPGWNVWDGYNEHWASARLWVALPVLTGLAAAGVAAVALLSIGPGGQEVSTTSYFWAGTSLIVIAGYLATVAGVWLFGHGRPAAGPTTAGQAPAPGTVAGRT